MATDSNLIVGYSKLPGRTSEGSRADYNKAATQDARVSMSTIVGRFQDLVRSLKAKSPKALEVALTPTFEKAQLYCPKKTLALVRSGALVTGMSGTRAYAQISFGAKGEVHYAAIVHERTDLHHVHPTRSKYLQAAAEEDFNDLQGRFAAAIQGGA